MPLRLAELQVLAELVRERRITTTELAAAGSRPRNPGVQLPSVMAVSPS